MLEERTIGGLHAYVFSLMLAHPVGGSRAIDLGTGSGAFALRIRDLGFEVTAVDIDGTRFGADVPFILLDLDTPDFASQLGSAAFDLVTAVEVIEHCESPIGFLRNVRRLLKPGGIAVITTPNVDNLPARLKFCVTGKVRMLDSKGDPTHISPIFWDLITRQWLPKAGLRLVRHVTYPARGYRVTRRGVGFALRVLASTLSQRGETLHGDNHVFFLESSI